MATADDIAFAVVIMVGMEIVLETYNDIFIRLFSRNGYFVITLILYKIRSVFEEGRLKRLSMLNINNGR